jgi:hypothetical protein
MQSFSLAKDAENIGQIYSVGSSIEGHWDFDHETDNSIQSQVMDVESLSEDAESTFSALLNANNQNETDECPLVGGSVVFYARALYEASTEAHLHWEFLRD